MGSCGSSEKKTKETIHDTYAKTGMSQPWGGDTENTFEKEYFMALNLFRHNPGKFTSHFKDLKKQCPEFKDDAKLIDKICVDLREVKGMT